MIKRNLLKAGLVFAISLALITGCTTKKITPTPDSAKTIASTSETESSSIVQKPSKDETTAKDESATTAEVTTKSEDSSKVELTGEYESTATTATEKPTETATQAPTQVPTQKPTEAATQAPTQVPTTKPTEAATQTPTSSQDAAYKAYYEEVLRLVNEIRAEVGVAPLILDDTLCQAASVRAMEINDCFDHVRPDGTSCFTVLSEFNITYYTVGENIAAGYPTPEAVVTGWKNSPGHYANMINASFGKLGVGYYQTSSGYRHHWVQIFTN